jgi:hypothetical protein
MAASFVCIYLSPVCIILYAVISAALKAEPMNSPIPGALQELVYLELAYRIKYILFL